MQVASIKVNFAAKPVIGRRASALKPRQAVLVRGAPEKSQIDQAVKEAEEACAGGDAGEWYVERSG